MSKLRLFASDLTELLDEIGLSEYEPAKLWTSLEFEEVSKFMEFCTINTCAVRLFRARPLSLHFVRSVKILLVNAPDALEALSDMKREIFANRDIREQIRIVVESDWWYPLKEIVDQTLAVGSD